MTFVALGAVGAHARTLTLRALLSLGLGGRLGLLVLALGLSGALGGPLGRRLHRDAHRLRLGRRRELGDG